MDFADVGVGLGDILEVLAAGFEPLFGGLQIAFDILLIDHDLHAHLPVFELEADDGAVVAVADGLGDGDALLLALAFQFGLLFGTAFNLTTLFAQSAFRFNVTGLNRISQLLL